jgi:hypothetical protein
MVAVTGVVAVRASMTWVPAPVTANSRCAMRVAVARAVESHR